MYLKFAINSAEDVRLSWKEFLSKPHMGNLFLTGKPKDELLHIFMQNFKVVEAAGGLVYNQNEDLLCIYRWDKWDLPKGKIEKKEKPDEAALREVEEETGIACEIDQFLTKTYHIFKAPWSKDQMILKPTHWYKMHYNGNADLVPQEKEDIIDARWFSKNELDLVRANTYSSLLDLFIL